MDETANAILNIVLRLGVSMILSGIVGWERQTKEKPAGLRTHILVGMGACSFTLITLNLFQMSLIEGSARPGDPIHVVEGVIGGIGFLGAGSILRSGGTVEGITTAAGIWVVGSIGIACGAGYYWIALITTLFVFITLTLLRLLEKRSIKSND